MGVYKVNSITHSGSMGERGSESERKLRILELDERQINVGKRLFMECVGDFMKSMITSPVTEYRMYGNRLTIETENLIYRLEKLNAEK